MEINLDLGYKGKEHFFFTTEHLHLLVSGKFLTVCLLDGKYIPYIPYPTTKAKRAGYHLPQSPGEQAADTIHSVNLIRLHVMQRNR